MENAFLFLKRCGEWLNHFHLISQTWEALNKCVNFDLLIVVLLVDMQV